MTLTLEQLAPPQVPVGLIDTADDNPRDRLGDLVELTDSVRELGILQPLVVSPTIDGRFKLIAGHRRLAAAQRAGLAEVPVTFSRIAAEDGKMRLAAMVAENTHRVDLTPMERAKAYQRLQEEFDLNQTEVARLVGKSPAHVNQTLQLLKPVDVRAAEIDTYRERREAGVPQRGRPLADATVVDTMALLKRPESSNRGATLTGPQVKLVLRLIEQGAWALQRERVRDMRLAGVARADVA